MLIYLIFSVLLLSFIGLLCLCVVSAWVYKAAVDLTPELMERSKLKKDIEIADKTLRELSTSMNSMRNDIANAEHTIANAEIQKQYLEENAGEVALLKEAISGTKQKLQAQNEAYKEREAQYNENKDEWARVSKLCDDQDARNVSLASEKTRLDAEIEEAKKDKTSHEAATETAKTKRDKAEAEASEATKTLSDLRRKINEKIADLAGLETKINLATSESSKLESMIQKAEEKIKANEENMLELHKKERVLSTSVASLSGQNEARDEIKKACWSDLDSPYPFIKTGKRLAQPESDWLREFKQNLKDSGIIFSDRMIHAFHTGLKTAAASPLVVLAGISGTGKSLLPELYARALGMNFLQVPVQPRWDSPQDMLGFYNYMESRYKATDLSRMLWQSDRYNNKDKVSAERGNALNMVLLDEMNLARVEYYFSDMLSKLEVRRGIDPDDKNQRQAAELRLECGAANKIIPQRSLFIGPNTLFVGTMNEDDSTQNLSDKVMDRANVLRFGQPSSLDAKPNKGAFWNKYDDREHITRSDWQEKWVKPTVQSKEICDILESVNNQMGAIGRPFAHRVSQSINAYINNYPKGANSKEHALADQLEMKVIPKLTGVELDSSKTKAALTELRQIIESKTKDDKLSKAFEAAISNESGFFQWKGVAQQ